MLSSGVRTPRLSSEHGGSRDLGRPQPDLSTLKHMWHCRQGDILIRSLQISDSKFWHFTTKPEHDSFDTVPCQYLDDENRHRRRGWVILPQIRSSMEGRQNITFHFKHKVTQGVNWCGLSTKPRKNVSMQMQCSQSQGLLCFEDACYKLPNK